MHRLFIKDMEADRKAERVAYEALAAETPWMWPAVYVMASDAGGSIKVGYSKRPAKRILDLQVSNQDTLRVFWVLRVKGDGARKLERTFHQTARKTPHHLRGEWYSLKPEIAVSALKKIAVRLQLETHHDLQFGYERGL